MSIAEEKIEYDSVNFYLKQAGKVKLLSKGEEIELARKVKQGGEEGKAAKERFILANLRLVVNLAKFYQPRASHLEYLDLIQEGNAGLITAVERFDESKGWKFSTYASHWIKQGMQRALANKDREIRLPVHAVEEIMKMKKAQAQVSREGECTDEAVAKLMGVKPEKVAELRIISQETVSLNQFIRKASSGTHSFSDIELLDRMTGIYVADNQDKNLISEQVVSYLKVLNNQQRQVIKMYYGLDGNTAVNMYDIAAVLGVTRQRVSQIHRNALTRLRRPEVKKRLKGLLDD